MRHAHFIVLSLLAAGSLLAAEPVLGQWMGGESVPLGEPAPALPAGESDSGFDFKIDGMLGAATITNPETGLKEIFNIIALQPELSFGKLGLGLDLYVYFNSDGKFRKEDWDTREDFVSKIRYVRWGKRGDLFYARMGGLSGTTLGHGFIMGNYTNRLRYPDVRRVGVVAGLDAGYGGFEAVATDIRRPTLHGGRVFLRPLYGTGIPLLKNLSFGLSGVSDRDPDGFKGTQNDQVSVYGVDLDMPVFKNDLFSATLFADAALMRLGRRYTQAGSKDNGKGGTAGIGGNILFLSYSAEMRVIENNFIPNFFDAYYEVDRSSGTSLKADGIPSTHQPRRTGPLVQVYADIMNRLHIGAFYENLNSDPLGIYPRLWGEIRIDPELLFNKFYAAARYEQRNVEQFKRIGQTRDPNTIMTTEIGYKPNENLTIVVVQKQTFDLSGKPVRSTQIRADVRF